MSSSNYNALKDITAYIAKFKCRNVLNDTYSDQTFTYNDSGANVNKVSLKLSRSNSNLNSPTTILPLTVSNSYTKSNSVDQLEWQVRSSTALTGGITADFSDLSSSGYTNSDYQISDIGTLVKDTVYTISYKCRNKYHTGYYPSSDPNATTNQCQIKMMAPNVPSDVEAAITISDNHPTTNVNKIVISWTKPSQPGLFTKLKGQDQGSF